MIHFNNLSNEAPYILFKEIYDKAAAAAPNNIQAISIASYNTKANEVDSRYVNLKFVENKKFIFFSNYSSPKSKAFKTHNQVTSLIYWDSINVQIRMKSKIARTNDNYNQAYFAKRDVKKNALAISSQQSKYISSYNAVKEEYERVLNDGNLSQCPDFWGGFFFIPYYFEFWEGHESRINKREIFNITDGEWKHSFLQP